MRSITRYFLAFLLIAGAAYTFAAPMAMAQQKTEDRHVSDFHGIDVSGPYDVTLTQGKTESVKVEAPEDVIRHVTTEVENGILKIYDDRHNFHWGDLFSHHKKIMVYVTIKDVNSIVVSGSGDVTFHNGLHADKMNLHVSGSGDVDGDLEVKSLETSISGSGDVKLTGHAETSAVRVSGSGDYSARGLITTNTDVHVSGSGDAKIYASNKVDASVSGSGDISYSGHPKNVYKSKSGSGDIGGD